MVVLIVCLLIAFLVYGIPCYLNYRIVAKFNPDISVWENFIPIWNIYILAKQVMSKPGIYVLIQFFVIAFSVAMVIYILSLDHQGQMYFLFHVQEYGGLINSINLVQYVLTAYLWGRVAKGLGKNFWVYAALAFFGLPLLVIVPIFALDSSKPINMVNE